MSESKLGVEIMNYLKASIKNFIKMMQPSTFQFNNRWYPILLWVMTLGLTIADLGFLWVQVHFSLSLPWYAHLLFYSALGVKVFLLSSLIRKRGAIRQQIKLLSGLLIISSLIGLMSLWNTPNISFLLLLEKLLIIAAGLLLWLPLERSLKTS